MVLGVEYGFFSIWCCELNDVCCILHVVLYIVYDTLYPVCCMLCIGFGVCGCCVIDVGRRM